VLKCHAMKAYNWSGDKAAGILVLGIKWEWVFTFVRRLIHV
jgi:hypothetical protein